MTDQLKVLAAMHEAYRADTDGPKRFTNAASPHELLNTPTQVHTADHPYLLRRSPAIAKAKAIYRVEEVLARKRPYLTALNPSPPTAYQKGRHVLASAIAFSHQPIETVSVLATPAPESPIINEGQGEDAHASRKQIVVVMDVIGTQELSARFALSSSYESGLAGLINSAADERGRVYLEAAEERSRNDLESMSPSHWLSFVEPLEQVARAMWACAEETERLGLGSAVVGSVVAKGLVSLVLSGEAVIGAKNTLPFERLTELQRRSIEPYCPANVLPFMDEEDLNELISYALLKGFEGPRHLVTDDQEEVHDAQNNKQPVAEAAEAATAEEPSTEVKTVDDLPEPPLATPGVLQEVGDRTPVVVEGLIEGIVFVTAEDVIIGKDNVVPPVVANNSDTEVSPADEVAQSRMQMTIVAQMAEVEVLPEIDTEVTVRLNDKVIPVRPVVARRRRPLSASVASTQTDTQPIPFWARSPKERGTWYGYIAREARRGKSEDNDPAEEPDYSDFADVQGHSHLKSSEERVVAEPINPSPPIAVVSTGRPKSASLREAIDQASNPVRLAASRLRPSSAGSVSGWSVSARPAGLSASLIYEGAVRRQHENREGAVIAKEAEDRLSIGLQEVSEADALLHSPACNACKGSLARM